MPERLSVCLSNLSWIVLQKTYCNKYLQLTKCICLFWIFIIFDCLRLRDSLVNSFQGSLRQSMKVLPVFEYYNFKHGKWKSMNTILFGFCAFNIKVLKMGRKIIKQTILEMDRERTEKPR